MTTLRNEIFLKTENKALWLMLLSLRDHDHLFRARFGYPYVTLAALLDWMWDGVSFSLAGSDGGQQISYQEMFKERMHEY